MFKSQETRVFGAVATFMAIIIVIVVEALK